MVWISGVPDDVECAELAAFLERKVGAVRRIIMQDDGALVTFNRASVAELARKLREFIQVYFLCNFSYIS